MQQPETAFKLCVHCGAYKPVSEFSSRSGRGAGRRRRRGTCRDCRRIVRSGEGAAGPETPGREELPLAPPFEPAEPGGSGRKKRRRGKAKRSAAEGSAVSSAGAGEAIAAAPEAEEATAERAPAADRKKRRRGRRSKAKGPAAGDSAVPASGAGEAIAAAPEADNATAERAPAADRKKRKRGRRSKAKGPAAGDNAVPASDAGAIAAEPGADEATAERAPAPERKKRKKRRRKKAKAPAAARGLSRVPALPAPAGVPFFTPHHAAPVAVPRDIKLAARKRNIDPLDATALRPTREGFIRMRGKTDGGRSYYQEVEPEFAKILVRENAAFVLNRHTIRRIYSNREFRKLILTRDNYTCRFCGRYGDTIDHLLPRAKGGHTTPVNCVCACIECNQSKADRDLEEFTVSLSDLLRPELSR